MRLCGSNRREKLNFYFQLTSQILQKLTRTLSQRVPPGGSGTAETISTLTQFLKSFVSVRQIYVGV